MEFRSVDCVSNQARDLIYVFRTDFLGQDRLLGVTDEFRALLFDLIILARQKNCNQALGAIEPAPTHVISSPASIEKSAKGHQRAAGKFLPLFPWRALVDERSSIFRADTMNCDWTGFTHARAILNGISHQIVQDKIAIEMVQTQTGSARTFAKIDIFGASNAQRCKRAIAEIVSQHVCD